MVMIHVDFSKSYADPVVYNSYIFHTKVQQPDEPFDNYLSAITELAKLCEFESLEERMIRDKIIAGINSPSLRNKLLKLKDPKLSNIVEYCRLMEKDTRARNEKEDGKTTHQLKKQFVFERKLVMVTETDNNKDDPCNKENLNVENQDVRIQDTDFEIENPVIDIKQEVIEEEVNYESDLTQSDDEADTIPQNADFIDVKVEPTSNYEQLEEAPLPEGNLISTINKNFVRLQNVFSLKNENDLMVGEGQEGNNVRDYLVYYDSTDKNAPGTSDANIFHTKCNHCSEEFITREDLEAHFPTCQNQNQNVPSRTNIKLMINKNFQFIKRNLIEKPFVCTICKKAFSKQKSLKNHYRSHYNDGRCKCNVCGKTFGFPSELKQHSLVHSEDKPFKCRECDAAFKERKTLKTHLTVHMKERPFKCEKCGKSFARKFYLDTHMAVHTGKKPFECQGCNKGFGDITSLKRHVLIHTGEKPYKCDVCDKHFREKGALRKHVFVHSTNKPYRCEDCGKEYAQKASLKNHSMVHTGEKPYKCEVCNLTCRDKAGLKTHSYLHSGDLPFKCTQCDKAYRDKNTLNRHLVIHMEESPYKCNVCNATFRGGNNLKNHLFIHTGEKPYACNDCGRAFRSKSTLKEHLYRIHKSVKITKRSKKYNLRKVNRKKLSKNWVEEDDEEEEEEAEEEEQEEAVTEVIEANNVEIKTEENSEVEEEESMEVDERLEMKTEEEDGV